MLIPPVWGNHRHKLLNSERLCYLKKDTFTFQNVQIKQMLLRILMFFMYSKLQNIEDHRFALKIKSGIIRENLNQKLSMKTFTSIYRQIW